MATSASRLAVLAVALAGGAALAGDDGLPDEEFLEYLGIWQESDEEWLIFGDPAAPRVDTGPDRERPEKEESVETKDEA